MGGAGVYEVCAGAAVDHLPPGQAHAHHPVPPAAAAAPAAAAIAVVVVVVVGHAVRRAHHHAGHLRRARLRVEVAAAAVLAVQLGLRVGVGPSGREQEGRPLVGSGRVGKGGDGGAGVLYGGPRGGKGGRGRAASVCNYATVLSSRKGAVCMMWEGEGDVRLQTAPSRVPPSPPKPALSKVIGEATVACTGR